MVGRMSPSVVAAMAIAGSNAFVARAQPKKTGDAAKADKYFAEQNARMAKPKKSSLLPPCTKETSRAARRNRARKKKAASPA